MSLQALADLALQEKIERKEAMCSIQQYMELVDTPSIHARSKKLLEQLASPSADYDTTLR